VFKRRGRRWILGFVIRGVVVVMVVVMVMGVPEAMPGAVDWAWGQGPGAFSGMTKK
jgi:hypothetical protein